MSSRDWVAHAGRMPANLRHWVGKRNLNNMKFSKPILGLAIAVILALAGPLTSKEEMLPDMTGTYEFLSADDTMGLLEEEERVRGYIDVAQGEDESDAILSYQLEGTRKFNQVEFKTKAIHRRYYRFSGRVERGSGKAEKDPDFLRLAGALETVTVNGETGEETVQRKDVVFKSRPPQKESEDN